MTLQVHRDSDGDGEVGAADAVVSCDVELPDGCRTLEELGERRGWSDQQFHDFITGPEYGWTFDPRNRRYLCPPCAHTDQQRRQPAALAKEGFATPFEPRTPPRRRLTDAGNG